LIADMQKALAGLICCETQVSRTAAELTVELLLQAHLSPAFVPFYSSCMIFPLRRKFQNTNRIRPFRQVGA